MNAFNDLPNNRGKRLVDAINTVDKPRNSASAKTELSKHHLKVNSRFN